MSSSQDRIQYPAFSTQLPLLSDLPNFLLRVLDLFEYCLKKLWIVTETRGLCSIHHQQQHKKLRALGDEFLPRSNPVTGIFNSTAPAFGFAHGPDTKVNRLVKIEAIIYSNKTFHFEFKMLQTTSLYVFHSHAFTRTCLGTFEILCKHVFGLF